MYLIQLFFACGLSISSEFNSYLRDPMDSIRKIADREYAKQNMEFYTPSKEEIAVDNLYSLLAANVEVIKNFSEDLQLVIHHRDKYTLELPEYLSISASGIRQEDLDVVDKRNPEDISEVYLRSLSNTSIGGLFQESLSHDPDSKLIKIKEPGVNFEAYKIDAEYDFDYILIPHGNKTFKIGPYGLFEPDFDLMIRILKGLSFDD